MNSYSNVTSFSYKNYADAKNSLDAWVFNLTKKKLLCILYLWLTYTVTLLNTLGTKSNHFKFVCENNVLLSKETGAHQYT